MPTSGARKLLETEECGAIEPIVVVVAVVAAPRPFVRAFSNSFKQSTRRALTSLAYVTNGRIVSGVNASRGVWVCAEEVSKETEMSTEEEAVEEEGALAARGTSGDRCFALPESEDSRSQSDASSASSVVTNPPVADDPLPSASVPLDSVFPPSVELPFGVLFGSFGALKTPLRFGRLFPGFALDRFFDVHVP